MASKLVPVLVLTAACLVAWRVVPTPVATADPAADAAALVERLESVADKIAELERQAEKATGAARRSLQESARRVRAEQLMPLAFEIDHTYHAKVMLKTSRKDLGRTYYELMRGVDGDGGVLGEILDDVRSSMRADYGDLVDRIQSIQNAASKAAKNAPMDIDIGVFTATPEEARQLLKELGGPGGEERFREILNDRLRKAYERVAARYGFDADVARLYLSGTTIFDPEAYLDSLVLGDSGLFKKNLLENTADVSKNKNNHLWNAFLSGPMDADEAYREVIRGTRKDLQKVERIFDHLERITGERPQLRISGGAAQTGAGELALERAKKVLGIMKDVDDMVLDPRVGEQMIRKLTGKDLKAVCNELLDTGFTAVKLAPHPKLLKARLFKAYILDPDALKRAVQAIVSGDLEQLPKAAQALQKELSNVGGFRLTTLMETDPRKFMWNLKQQLGDKLVFRVGDEADEVVTTILKRLNTMSGEELTYVFGPEYAPKLKEVRRLVTPAVRASLLKRLWGAFKNSKPVVEAFEFNKRLMQIGVGEFASFKSMAFDGIMGAAFAMAQTHAILEGHDSEAEKQRLIERAWVAAVPGLGDASESLCSLTEAYYEGSSTKAVRGGLYCLIALCYATPIPGAQGVATVAGLMMGAYELGLAALDVAAEKELLWTWVACGEWPFGADDLYYSGTLEGVYDAKGTLHTFGSETDPAKEAAFLLEQFVAQGDVTYSTPLRGNTQMIGHPGMTLRESLHDLCARTLLAQAQEFGILRAAILGLYPDFDVDKHLIEPAGVGMKALRDHIRGVSTSENYTKDVCFVLFGKLKFEYDKLLVKIIKGVRADAEAEFQVMFSTESVRATWARLAELQAEYRLPLRKSVDGIYTEHQRFFLELLKTPLEKRSLPRRHLELAKRYIAAYDGPIRAGIERLRGLFERAGVKPPSKINPHNMCGYMDLDKERIGNLEQAYGAALVKARQKVKALFQAALPEGHFDDDDPCVKALFTKLASNRLRRVHAEDLRLLYEEWAGRRNAAAQARDAEVEKARQQIDAGFDGVLTIPHYMWTRIADLVGNLYAWNHLTVQWQHALLGFSVEKSYLEATAPLRQRIKALDDEYVELQQLGVAELSACLSSVTVHMRTRGTDGEDRPVEGGRVDLTGGRRGVVHLKAVAPGTWRCPVPPPGDYEIVAWHGSYRTEEGESIARRAVTQEAAPPRGIAPPIVETIYLVSLNQPRLELDFAPARADALPTLTVTLTASREALVAETLTLKVGELVVDQPTVTASRHDKVLTVVHEFAATMPPGPMQATVSVTDAVGDGFTLGGAFAYVPGLTLKTGPVDDAGGAPEDGQANAGEAFRLPLVLESHEPSPLVDVVLTYLPGTPHLTATGELASTYSVLVPSKPASTSSLALTCDANLAQPVEAWLAFEVQVGGVALDDALKVPLPLRTGMGPTISFVRVDDATERRATNRADGKANAGEAIGLVFEVHNPSKQAFAGIVPKGNGGGGLLTIGTAPPITSLAPGETAEVTLPATVRERVMRIGSVPVVVTLESGGREVAAVEMSITLYPAPLPIRLVGTVVKDPDSGALAKRNDGNGQLGAGERVFLDVTLLNDGPAIDDAVVDLQALARSVTVEKAMAAGAGTVLPTGQPTTRRFVLDVPSDFRERSLDLRVNVVSAHEQNQWETTTTLSVDDTSAFEAELVLDPSDPAAWQGGARLGWTLVLRSRAKTDLLGVMVLLSSGDVALADPDDFYDQDFAPGQERRYEGKLRLPSTLPAGGFAVVLQVLDEVGIASFHERRFVFRTDLLATKIAATSSPLDEDGSRWKLEVAVTDTKGRPVPGGDVTLATSYGTLTDGRLALKKGCATTTWTRPEGTTGQALVELAYAGHDPAQGEPGPACGPATLSTFVPPGFRGTLGVEVAGHDDPRAITVVVTGPGFERQKKGQAVEFTDLPAGTYRIQARAPRREPVEQLYDFDPAEPGEVHWALLAFPPSPDGRPESEDSEGGEGGIDWEAEWTLDDLVREYEEELDASDFLTGSLSPATFDRLVVNRGVGDNLELLPDAYKVHLAPSHSAGGYIERHYFQCVMDAATVLWAIENGCEPYQDSIHRLGGILMGKETWIGWEFGSYYPPSEVESTEPIDNDMSDDSENMEVDTFEQKVVSVRGIPSLVRVRRTQYTGDALLERTTIYVPNSRFAARIVVEDYVSEANALARLNSLLANVDEHIQIALRIAEQRVRERQAARAGN